MAEEIKAGCARPTGGPVGENRMRRKKRLKPTPVKEVKAWSL